MIKLTDELRKQIEESGGKIINLTSEEFFTALKDAKLLTNNNKQTTKSWQLTIGTVEQ